MVENNLVLEWMEILEKKTVQIEDKQFEVENKLDKMLDTIII